MIHSGHRVAAVIIPTAAGQRPLVQVAAAHGPTGLDEEAHALDMQEDVFTIGSRSVVEGSCAFESIDAASGHT